ncbi:NAD(P)/FAD-dependent oxidoreductase [Flavobacterium hercynium]|uniref:Pyridine nucleotide-disulfide oxidoreductase n=1 Tax=Flavobacterium hercynium TaxID=387094 RepID=A0A226HMN6_9FLAO|nr:NAD(P)/FAD-dependent oxidoreductase [Flavobacterium hercynium]OXA94770.1 pyridine nucleotide-disulfide oxidoreductase [Flavobacterium hercynium]SMP07886.1 Thioredoxin reductase [Flavobacterium hercynium]
MKQNHFDVIIIGGSYSGLSAAMSLGRALRQVLVIDSGLPCNRQTPHSHNFITQDGEKPAVISAKAKLQVEYYNSVQFYSGLATAAVKTQNGFEITTASGKVFSAKKILFSTGVKDLLPAIPGLAECWGISVIHCPYCHGYEVKEQKTAIIANGAMGFEYAKMISNWTKDLRILTNGKSTLASKDIEVLKQHNIQIIENEIDAIEHVKGNIKQIIFKDQSKMEIEAVYFRPPFEQHCSLIESLGCELTEQGLVKVDLMQKTTVSGIFASGDSCIQARSVAMAVSSGSFAGAAINKELIDAEFV